MRKLQPVHDQKNHTFNMVTPCCDSLRWRVSWDSQVNEDQSSTKIGNEQSYGFNCSQ